jgi:hypothetical protein
LSDSTCILNTEIKLNFMVFHAYKSSSRINFEQTDSKVTLVYNEFERILTGPGFKSLSEEIFSSPDMSRLALGRTQCPLKMGVGFVCQG